MPLKATVTSLIMICEELVFGIVPLYRVVFPLCLMLNHPALRHHIQDFCVRELGTRSETYRGSALTGGSGAQTLVR